jgi:hypothetical protein
MRGIMKQPPLFQGGGVREGETVQGGEEGEKV